MQIMIIKIRYFLGVIRKLVLRNVNKIIKDKVKIKIKIKMVILKISKIVLKIDYWRIRNITIAMVI